MPDFLRKMRNLFNGSQDEAATSQQDAPAEDMAEEDVDVMTELFGAYVNPHSDTAGTGAETDSVQEADDSHAENEKVYDNYDTDAIAADEIAAAAFSDEIPEKDLTAYAPKNMSEADPDKTEYLDLDELAAAAGLGPVQEKDGRLIETGAKTQSPFRQMFQRHRKVFIGVFSSVGMLCIILGVLLVWWMNIDPLDGYVQLTVGRGNVIKTMMTGGNIEPYAKYDIVPLVSGEITEAPFEVGDTVSAGDLLYQIDDTEASLAVQRAENEVEKARATEEETAASISELNIYAPASGEINNLTLRVGSSVTGGEVATITRSDGSIVSVMPGVQGIVRSVSVREGQTVRNGQLIATLRSESLEASQKSQEIDVKSAEIDVESAQNNLEAYSVESPVDGTILLKNGKVGDTAVAGDSANPLMVVADMSQMKLVFQVDELDVWNMELGQSVIVTADALPDETFTGEVTNIANEGKIQGDGVTTFDVEITIENTDDLKAGMNVSAKIILQSATNVITIPEEALMEADGKNAAVFIKSVNPEETEAPVSSSANPEEEEQPYAWITPPEGCEVVPVRYGISDGVNVQILSGLSEGDILVYESENPVTYTGVIGGASPAPSSSPSRSARMGSGENDEADAETDADIVSPSRRPTATGRPVATPSSQSGRRSGSGTGLEDIESGLTIMQQSAEADG